MKKKNSQVILVAPVKLERRITLLNGITVIVGSIIGSGIFISPKGVLVEIGSVAGSLIIWLACGIFSMIGAYCYTELGTSVTKSGADYVYIHKAFGPLPAFIRLWVDTIIIRPCSAAVVALTFANYVIEAFFPDCQQPTTAVRLLAAFAILTLTFINAIDVIWAMRVQDIFTYAKLMALVLISITGAVQLFLGRTENFKNPFENTYLMPGAIALSFYQGLFAYNGWNYLNFVVEELKNPNRNLPIAAWVSIILVTAIYLFCNISYFTVISPEEMLESNTVAVTFAQKMYGSMAWTMPLFVALSTFGGVNGIIFTSARLFYAGSKEGHMPLFLCYVQMQRLTPAISVLFIGLMSCLYLVSTDMYLLIQYVSFVNWAAIALSILALLKFRRSNPDMHRPIKVGLFWPIIYLTISVFLALIPFFVSPYETLIGCAITATGIPVYIVFVYWKSKPKSFIRFTDNLTRFLQKLFLVVPEDSNKDS